MGVDTNIQIQFWNKKYKNLANVWKLLKEMGVSKCKDSYGIVSLKIDNNSIEIYNTLQINSKIFCVGSIKHQGTSFVI